MLSVAIARTCAYFLKVCRVAVLASRRWLVLDMSNSLPLPSTSVAGAPILPVVPHTVVAWTTGTANLIVACLRFHDGAVAAFPTIFARGYNLTRFAQDTTSTILGARSDLPTAEDAVYRRSSIASCWRSLTRGRVTWREDLQRPIALFAFSHRLHCNLSRILHHPVALC